MSDETVKPGEGWTIIAPGIRLRNYNDVVEVEIFGVYKGIKGTLPAPAAYENIDGEKVHVRDREFIGANKDGIMFRIGFVNEIPPMKDQMDSEAEDEFLQRATVEEIVNYSNKLKDYRNQSDPHLDLELLGDPLDTEKMVKLYRNEPAPISAEEAAARLVEMIKKQASDEESDEE